MRHALPIFALLAAAGCQKGEETTIGGPIGIIGRATSPTNRNGGRGAGAIVYAHVRRARFPVPPRFSAPLPASPVELDDAPRRPPDGFVRGAVCSGDRAMQERVLEALRRADKNHQLDQRVADYYSGLFRYCGSNDACEWLQTVVEGGDSRGVKRALWPALVGCGGDEYTALFSRSDAPSGAVIDWYFEQTWTRTLKWSPRLVSAASDVARSGEGYQIRKVGLVLAAIDHPRALSSLTTLSRRLPDRDRPWLFVGLRDHPSAAARKLYQRACAELPQEPLCASSTGGVVEPPDDVETIVRAWGVDLSEWLESRPKLRPRVVRSLAVCVLAVEEASGRCLRHLALLDRARALELAAGLATDPPPEGYLAEVAFVLLRFPDASMLRARLEELGLVKSDVEYSAAVTVEDYLSEGGRATQFDTETGTFPNEHDVLARSLAGLIELDDVIFEEIPPADVDANSNYLLRAYSRGMRFETIARNYGDWYDLDAVIGLLNVVLRDRKQPERFVTLPTGDQTAFVLAAPQDGLRRAAEEGLITLAGTEASMNAGKSFEQQVFEELRSGGESSPEPPPPEPEE